MMPGQLITVEGIDASGKSTVAADLVRALRAAGAPAVLVDRCTVADLTDGYPATHLLALAGLIWDYPAGARTSELGFWHWSHLLAAWFHAVDLLVVRPALARGEYVVADSWCGKFVARFALTVGVRRAQEIFAGVSTPNRVLWLDVAPELCAGRRAALRTTERGEWHGLDGLDNGYLLYQGRIRSVYRSLAAAGGWRVVTAVDRAGVHAEVLAEVDRALAGPRGAGKGLQ